MPVPLTRSALVKIAIGTAEASRIAERQNGKCFKGENGDDKQLLVYWYQGRGRKVASEYWGKIYTVIDSVRRRRSDGAMVRIMVPMGNSEQSALDTATALAAEIAPFLPGFVPD